MKLLLGFMFKNCFVMWYIKPYFCVFLMHVLSYRDSTSMHGSLIVGMELRLTQLEDKLSDVDARASEEADCGANERELDRFIYSGDYLRYKFIFWSVHLMLCKIFPFRLRSCHYSV